MAAASERGEKVNPKVNFRTFAARKKTEYALRFPFLTERQILAKLRRVWQCRKEALADGRRGDSAIDPTPVRPRAATAVVVVVGDSHKENRGCCRGDLSAFDIDSDEPSLPLPPTPLPPLPQSPLHPLPPTPLLPLPQSPTPSLSSAVRDEVSVKIHSKMESASSNHNMIAHYPLLKTRENIITTPGIPKPQSSNLSATFSMNHKNGENKPYHLSKTSPSLPPHPHQLPPPPSPPSPTRSYSSPSIDHESQPTPSQNSEVTTLHETECLPTNRVPLVLATQEDQHSEEVGHENCVKTTPPHMAGIVVGSLPTLQGLRDDNNIPSYTMGMPALSGSQKAPRDVTLLHHGVSTSDRIATPAADAVGGGAPGAVRTSQDSPSPSRSSQFDSLYGRSRIHPLPSLSHTPLGDPAVFLQPGTTSLYTIQPSSSPTTAAEHIDEIREFRASQSHPTDNSLTQTDKSSSSLSPTTNPLLINNTIINEFSNDTGTTLPARTGGKLPRRSNGGVRRLRRTRKSYQFHQFLHQAAGEESNLTLKSRPHHLLEQQNVNLPMTCSKMTTDASTSEPSLRTEIGNDGKEHHHLLGAAADHVVPIKDIPYTASPPSLSNSTPPPPPPLTHKEDLMCDMFQPLTPDLPPSSPSSSSSQLSQESNPCHPSPTRPSTHRRVFRSAITEGNSNFYTMFVNDSDIFM